MINAMLKKIGEIYRITHDKKIVIKLTSSTSLPPLYITVYDYGMKRIGILYDIIGPVSSPFGLVKPTEEALKEGDKIIGKSVYVRVIDLERRGGKRVKAK